MDTKIMPETLRQVSQPVLLIGYAAVPNQRMTNVYSPMEALEAGTLFPELNLPFGVYGKEGFEA